MINKRNLIVVLSFLLFLPLVVSAQTVDLTDEAEPKLEVRINSEDFVHVNRNIIFDASESSLLDIKFEPSYSWQFGDSYFDSAVEVVHQYTKTGVYTVEVALQQGVETASSSKDIFVYDTKALLITDEAKAEEFELLNQQAQENAVALKILPAIDEQGFLTEDKLVQEIVDLDSYIRDSDVIIFFTRSSLGLQAFTRYFQEADADKQALLRKKTLVHVTNSNIDVAGNFTYQAFKVMGHEHILLTRPEALGPLFAQKDFSQLPEILHERGIEFKIVKEEERKSFVWILSHFVNHILGQGVGSNTIYLILVIPFLTFIAVFFRQVIGITSFGIYTPVIVTASFYILGLWFGLLTFLFAVITSYLVKNVLNRFELLYLPKVALNLAFISLALLVVVWLGLLFGVEISLALAIFPMLVMSTVAEKFMAVQTEEGFRGALFAVLGTLVVVIASYYFILWNSFNNLVMSWPELILLPLLLNFLLGKFTGLRLGEYIRFKSLFSEHVEE